MYTYARLYIELKNRKWNERRRRRRRRRRSKNKNISIKTVIEIIVFYFFNLKSKNLHHLIHRLQLRMYKYSFIVSILRKSFFLMSVRARISVLFEKSKSNKFRLMQQQQRKNSNYLPFNQTLCLCIQKRMEIENEKYVCKCGAVQCIQLAAELLFCVLWITNFENHVLHRAPQVYKEAAAAAATKAKKEEETKCKRDKLNVHNVKLMGLAINKINWKSFQLLRDFHS